MSRPAASKPWIEKYRPRTLAEVQHQPEVVATLTSCIRSGSLPHLLFYGPPGTGKTSAALAAAHEVFGGELFRSRVLELNASDDRGIKAVRTKIKDFASTAVGAQGPPFKLIILDEADAMTTDAQNALRRTMETWAHVTRFCLICNYVSRIIAPLASRCAKFRFKPLPAPVLVSRLRTICSQENVETTDDALQSLVELCDGDLRRAIMLLQSAARLNLPLDNRETLLTVMGRPGPDLLSVLTSSLGSGSFDRVQLAVNKLVREGVDAATALASIHDHVRTDRQINDLQRAQCMLAIARADHCITDGADESLQLLFCASTCQRIYAGETIGDMVVTS